MCYLHSLPNRIRSRGFRGPMWAPTAADRLKHMQPDLSLRLPKLRHIRCLTLQTGVPSSDPGSLRARPTMAPYRRTDILPTTHPLQSGAKTPPGPNDGTHLKTTPETNSNAIS